ncbi:helix-turn-helix domain-containing protein [Trinickia sp.]|jgi:hypothetical protein|uniref:helix-turn-helix domain-containing protein n=1 Tax=Trinickia sp. TaxID=2571163 RepID=UPI0039C9428F
MSTIDVCEIESSHAESASREDVNIDNAFVQAYRRRIKESQKIFWSRFGVTQSRGSRFELGATIPRPVMLLLRLYFSGLITDEDLASVKQKCVSVHRPAPFNPDRLNPYGSL